MQLLAALRRRGICCNAAADRLGHVFPVLFMHASLSIALRDVSRVRSPCVLELHADDGNGNAESLMSN